MEIYWNCFHVPLLSSYSKVVFIIDYYIIIIVMFIIISAEIVLLLLWQYTIMFVSLSRRRSFS